MPKPIPLFYHLLKIIMQNRFNLDIVRALLMASMLLMGAFAAQAQYKSSFSFIDKGRVQNDARVASSAKVMESKRNLGSEMAAIDSTLQPFFHGVASGDPLADRVIIWTRVTPERDGDVVVRWSVATDTAFRNTVRSGSFTTNANRDYTVKIDVTGLEADRTYYYAFNALGANSLIGRTKTLPAPTAAVPQARFAFVSCSSYPHGFFNGYGRIADRNDLDGVLHLGDYIYEYGMGTTEYGAITGLQLGRASEPRNEIITLADYRTRYGLYRLDPDLRRFHQQQAMIHVWDDHESANDSYVDGAENHTAATEGSWAARKAVSKRVYYEWMPTRETADTSIYRRFAVGNLVDVFMLDTRLEGRQRQISPVGPDSTRASRQAAINDTNRTLLGARQFNWLTQGLQTSRAQWKLLGNQVMFTPVTVDSLNLSLVRQFAPQFLPSAPLILQTLQDAFYGDVWSNYPAERAKIVNFLTANNIRNTVIATGDFHTTFSFDVTLNPRTYNRQTGAGSVAVEFMCPSISAANFDENFFLGVYGLLLQQGIPDAAARAQANVATPLLTNTLLQTLSQQNPQIKNMELTRHGYTILDFTPARTQADYWFADTILARSTRENFGGGFVSQNNQSVIVPTQTPSAPKTVQATPAPALPPRTQVVSVRAAALAESSVQGLTLLGCYPNPAQTLSYINYTVEKLTPVTVTIFNALGSKVATILDAKPQQGNITILVDIEKLNLASGQYRYVISTPEGSTARALTIVR
jgi:alkaline phosphatase D